MVMRRRRARLRARGGQEAMAPWRIWAAARLRRVAQGMGQRRQRPASSISGVGDGASAATGEASARGRRRYGPDNGGSGRRPAFGVRRVRRRLVTIEGRWIDNADGRARDAAASGRRSSRPRRRRRLGCYGWNVGGGGRRRGSWCGPDNGGSGRRPAIGIRQVKPQRLAIASPSTGGGLGAGDGTEGLAHAMVCGDGSYSLVLTMGTLEVVAKALSFAPIGSCSCVKG